MGRDEEMVPGEDFMTLIMGLGGPDEPGHHGREKLIGMPHVSCCELIGKIRDMCDDFLTNHAGKDDDSASKDAGESGEAPFDSESKSDKEEK